MNFLVRRLLISIYELNIGHCHTFAIYLGKLPERQINIEIE